MTRSYLSKQNGKFQVIIYDNTLPKGQQYKWRSTGLDIKNNKAKAEQLRKQFEAEYNAKKEAAAKELPAVDNRDKLFADCVNCLFAEKKY